MYFDKPGEHNTDTALEIAFNEARKRKIKCVIVASTWGGNAEKALQFIGDGDVNLVVVTHNTGFKIPGVQEFSPEVRKKVEDAGGVVFTGSMPTRTLGRGVKNKLGFSQEDIACAAWRMLCEGMKVCVEIAAMACDAGLAPPEDVITVAGTGKGADTVLLIKAMPSNETFKMKVREILAKPRDW